MKIMGGSRNNTWVYVGKN